MWGKQAGPSNKKAGQPAQLGIVETMSSAPIKNDDGAGLVAVTNHRLEVLILEIKGGKTKVQFVDIAKSEDGIEDLAWSPCGRWLAYVKWLSLATSVIMVCDTQSSQLISRPVNHTL